MTSVKQGGIKYHFLSLWSDLTWDWIPVSRVTGQHSTPLANLVIIIFAHLYDFKSLFLFKNCNHLFAHGYKRGNNRGLVANTLDYDILVSEFEFQSLYYVHLRTHTLGEGINLLIFRAMG